MRLQVFLSHAGFCSRRRAMEVIKSGCVSVGDISVREPSYEINPAKDIVCVRGKRILLKDLSYIIVNKPKGVTTTKEDPFAKQTIIQMLPLQYKHLWPVGRLDKDTTGLLLLTNDGDLSYRLTHPKFCVNKIYAVSLDRPLSDRDRRCIEKGVKLEDGLTLPCSIVKLSGKKLKVTIREGRKRQIKRMFALLKYRVKELSRIAIDGIKLGALPLGQWRKLSETELVKLKKSIRI